MLNSSQNKTLNGPQSRWLTNENFYRLVLAAIILRVLLMPFFGHVDVLSEARRIFFWDQQGIYFDDISRNATSLFQLIFFKVFSVFIESKEMLFAHDDMLHSTSTPGEYFEFVSNPTIFRTLFVIKLPFLAADLVTAWALYKYCGRTPEARRATLFWLFNPITLFAFYIFGRFESIPVMFCMLSLLAIQRQHFVLAALMLGMSINSREIFIFFGPLFIALMCSPSSRQISMKVRFAACAIVMVAIAVSVQLISLTGSELDAFGRQVSSIASEGRVDYLFKFIVGSYLVFPMMYFVILLYAWNSSATLIEKTLLLYSYTLLCFFCFSSHTAHYTSWMVVFPCVYLSYQSELMKPMLMLCATWFLYNLSITDLGVFTTWLASPWSISLSGLPNFPMLYKALGFTNSLDLLTFQRICRTLYTASLFYIGLQMLLCYSARKGSPS
jgi:Gpi18-like mannosyltransferase